MAVTEAALGITTAATVATEEVLSVALAKEEDKGTSALPAVPLTADVDDENPKLKRVAIPPPKLATELPMAAGASGGRAGAAAVVEVEVVAVKAKDAGVLAGDSTTAIDAGTKGMPSDRPSLTSSTTLTVVVVDGGGGAGLGAANAQAKEEGEEDEGLALFAFMVLVMPELEPYVGAPLFRVKKLCCGAPLAVPVKPLVLLLLGRGGERGGEQLDDESDEREITSTAVDSVVAPPRRVFVLAALSFSSSSGVLLWPSKASSSNASSSSPNSSS